MAEKMLNRASAWPVRCPALSHCVTGVDSTRVDVTQSDNFVETLDTPSDLKRPVAGRVLAYVTTGDHPARRT